MGNADSRRKGLLTGAAVLAVVGAVLLVLGLIGVTGTATPHMTGFNDGATVEVPGNGMSVWARNDAARTATTCVAEGEDTSIVFERPVSSYSVDVGGTPFYEVARSPEGTAAAAYTLSCEGSDAAMYAGPRADRTAAPGLVGQTGLLIGAITLAAALLLGLVAMRGRRPQHAPADTAHPGSGQPYGASGYGASGAGAAGYGSGYGTDQPYAPPQGAPRGYSYGQGGYGDHTPYGQQPTAWQQPPPWDQPQSGTGTGSPYAAPSPYGQQDNPYGYGQPQSPYGQPQSPYGQPQSQYRQQSWGGQPAPSGQPYAAPSPYGQQQSPYGQAEPPQAPQQPEARQDWQSRPAGGHREPERSSPDWGTWGTAPESAASEDPAEDSEAGPQPEDEQR